MIRNLLLLSAASFVLAVVCLSGAWAIAGPDVQVEIDERGSFNWPEFASRGSRHHEEGAGGPRTTRRLDWDGAQAMTLDIPARVTYTQGSESSVNVSGPRSLVNRVELENGRLHFSGNSDTDWRDIPQGRLEIEITAPDINRFTLNGSQELSLIGYDQAALEISINGSGEVEAEGHTERLEVSISGSGESQLRDLVSDRAQIAITGSGDAEINSVDSAEILITGSGDVRLTQRPGQLVSRIIGTGEVTQSE